jgi:uncharacterized protein (UPF0332 family)
MSQSNPPYRIVIARSYYSMYHAIRAVVFFSHGGDDHEEHSALPKHIPPDFPERARWENKLKNARLERNRAEYDPYPKSEKAYAGAATDILTDAQTFLTLARLYLRKKGCFR